VFSLYLQASDVDGTRSLVSTTVIYRLRTPPPKKEVLENVTMSVIDVVSWNIFSSYSFTYCLTM
jgi:hypothetical protein